MNEQQRKIQDAKILARRKDFEVTIFPEDGQDQPGILADADKRFREEAAIANGVEMAQAWKRGGKAGLRAKMLEMFPDAATSTAKPTR